METNGSSGPLLAASASGADRPTPVALVLLAWIVVSLPLLWGIFQTLKKAAALFA